MARPINVSGSIDDAKSKTSQLINAGVVLGSTLGYLRQRHPFAARREEYVQYSGALVLAILNAGLIDAGSAGNINASA
jgi:hypothetical protein